MVFCGVGRVFVRFRRGGFLMRLIAVGKTALLFSSGKAGFERPSFCAGDLGLE
jgi:hypothetical protein